MIKVLFFIESLCGGGAEKVLTTLIKNLDKKIFDITVLSVVDIGVYRDEIKEYCNYKYMLPDYSLLNSKFEKLKYRLEYKWIYNSNTDKVYKKYIKEKYDVEIAFVEGFATKFIASSPNVNSKKICWVHIDMIKNSYADNCYSSISDEREVYMKYDHIIGVSNSVKAAFEQKFNLRNTVKVIYNPIDRKEIITKSEIEKIKKPNGLTIISIGRLEKQKGYDRLINILSSLEKYNFDYTLWILGEGSEKEKLEKIIIDSNLQKKVFLLGFKKNPYSFLKAADVFVCSSRAEGYSLVIAEAMILGKPVFSVDCSGPNEILNHGEFGKLVENTDDALSLMMFDLLSGKYSLEEYEKLSEKRKEFFDLKTIILDVENLLS